MEEKKLEFARGELVTKFSIKDDEKTLTIKEWKEDLQHFVMQYIIDKEEFITLEALKRIPTETLYNCKLKIENELQERVKRNECNL